MLTSESLFLLRDNNFIHGALSDLKLQKKNLQNSLKAPGTVEQPWILTSVESYEELKTIF